LPPSTGAPVRDHRNAVRNRSEHCPPSIGIGGRFRRNPQLAGEHLQSGFERSANFRWGGDEYEMLCGLCAAAALAKLADGKVLDGESGELLSPDQAVAQARQALQTVLKSDPRRGTRPADLRRYLKPLLQQRSDLLLIGRMLVIRPVRHILRGAFLERGGTDYILTYTFMSLLSYRLGVTDYRGRRKAMLYLWKPHFEPLLMDTLAEDIFEEVGRITSLEEFAAALPDEDWFPRASVTALHLSGQRGSAAAKVQQIKSPEWGEWRESQQDLLARDIAEICTLYHAREAEAVKELKLERIWEPSPFPVELPADQRKQRSDEPFFIPKPWPQRPEGLVADCSNHCRQRDTLRPVRRSCVAASHSFCMRRECADQRVFFDFAFFPLAFLAFGFSGVGFSAIGLSTLGFAATGFCAGGSGFSTAFGRAALENCASRMARS
jgi:hypothetical protein